MSVRTLSAQPPRFFDIFRAFQANFPRFFSEIALDPSSPKAEVTGSNPVGRASEINKLMSRAASCMPSGKHGVSNWWQVGRQCCHGIDLVQGGETVDTRGATGRLIRHVRSPSSLSTSAK
jgi:hypothetical protein